MARKPKTQPTPEAATATPAKEVAAMNATPALTRQGRQPKAAPPVPAVPSMMIKDSAATTDAEADTDDAAPVDARRRRGPNRKQKPSALADAAPLRQEQTKPGRGQTSRQPEAAAAPDPVGDDMRDAGLAPPPESAESAGPVQVDADPGSLSDGLQQPLPGLDVPSPTKPAAYWAQ